MVNRARGRATASGRDGAPSPVERGDVPDAWREYAARIEETPEGATTRGLFFSDIYRLVPRLKASAAAKRYLPFSKYPLRDYMQLLIDGARLAYPLRPPAEALRTLGLTTYDTFAKSMSGAALFSGASVYYERLLDLAPKAYELTLEPGFVAQVSRGSNEAVFKLRNVWSFPECYHVGIWLGPMAIFNVHGTIDVIRHSRCSVDFHLRWSKN